MCQCDTNNSKSDFVLIGVSQEEKKHGILNFQSFPVTKYLWHGDTANSTLETAPFFHSGKGKTDRDQGILPYFIFCLLVHNFRFFSEDVISLIEVSAIYISLLSMYIIRHIGKMTCGPKKLYNCLFSLHTHSVWEMICDAKLSTGEQKMLSKSQFTPSISGLDVTDGWGDPELFADFKSELIFGGGYSGLVRYTIYEFALRSFNSGGVEVF